MAETLEQLTAELSSLENELAQKQQSRVHIPGDPRKNISVRQNNPFNIKGPFWGATGVGSRGFAIYPTPEHGWQAGVNQILLDQSRPLTLRQFQEKYAPTRENPTWLANVMKLTGASPDTPIGSIPSDVLIRAVAQVESQARGPLDFERRVGKVAATTGDARKKLETELASLEAELAQLQKTAKSPGPRQLTVPSPDQNLPWATQQMRGIGRGLAGAAGVVGRIAETPGIKQGLWLLDLPMKPVRAGLEKIQEKVMEPHRARTEAEFAQYLKEPGAGTAAPEAFAPMPSKEAFVTPIELALMKKAYGLTGLLGKKVLQAPGAAKRFVTDPYALPGQKPLPAAAEAVQAPTGTIPAGSSISEAEDALNEALGLKGAEVAAPAAAPVAAPAAPVTPAAPATPWLVEAPERGIRQYPSNKGALPSGELPRVRYGAGFGPVSSDPFHRLSRTEAEKVADAAGIVRKKVFAIRPDVDKIMEQIKGIQGEVSGFPWTRPLYDPFLDKMRKVGGG